MAPGCVARAAGPAEEVFRKAPLPASRVIAVPDEALVLRVAPPDRVMPEEPRARTVLAVIGASRVSWSLSACSVTDPEARKAPGVREPLAWVMDKEEKSPSIVPPLRLKLSRMSMAPPPGIDALPPLMEPPVNLRSLALTVELSTTCNLPPLIVSKSVVRLLPLESVIDPSPLLVKLRGVRLRLPVPEADMIVPVLIKATESTNDRTLGESKD